MTFPEIQALIERARGPLPHTDEVLPPLPEPAFHPDIMQMQSLMWQLADALEQLLKERDITDEMVERAMISWHGVDGWRALCCNTMRRDKARRRMFAALEAALQPQEPAP